MNLELLMLLAFPLSLVGGLALIVVLPLWLSRHRPELHRELRKFSGNLCLLLSAPYLLLGFVFLIPAFSSLFIYPVIMRALTFSYGLALITTAYVIWPKTDSS